MDRHYWISRHPDGMGLDGRKYVLDDKGDVRFFDTIPECLDVLGLETVEQAEDLEILIQCDYME